MANTKSAKKRARKIEKKRVHNKYYKVTNRNLVKKLESTKKKEEAEILFPIVVAGIDKLTKKNIFHKNKAARLKSQLAKHVSELS